MNQPLPSWLVRAAAMLAPAIAGIVVTFAQPAPEAALRNIVFDWFQQLAPRAADPAMPVRVIDVDEDSLSRYGQWPWPRDRIAAAVDRLNGLGAAVVGLDIVLAEPDRSSPARILARVPDGSAKQEVLSALGGGDNDVLLAQALAAAPSVIGFVLTDTGGSRPPPHKGIVQQGDKAVPFLPAFAGVVAPLPELAAAAKGNGAFNWLAERDFVVRRVPLLLAADETILPSFALECLRVALGSTTIQIKASNASGETSFGRPVGIVAVHLAGPDRTVTVLTDPDGALRVRYAGDRVQRHIPFWRLQEGLVGRDEIDGRIVLLGSSAAVLTDVRATPLDPAMAGVDIHAEAIEQMLTGAPLLRPLAAPAIEMLGVFAGCLLAGAAVWRLRPLAAAAALLVLLAVPLAVAWAAFNRSGYVLDPVVPTTCILTTYIIGTLLRFRMAESERRAVREAFKHYVAPEVVDRLASDPRLLRLGGETRELTVLFSDLRNFTARAETMTAEEVVRFLNALHTPLTEAVLATRGTIDKYLGDGLMAFWNAPLDDEAHVENACRAALAMVACLPALRERIGQGAGHPDPIEIGIGLHAGSACVGNLGSAQRFDYSIVGDAVNVAARLEPLSKTYGVPIVASEAVAARAAAAGFGFVPLGDVALRGKSYRTAVFALHGGPEACGGPAFRTFLARHIAAWTAVRDGAPGAGELVDVAEASPDAAPYAQLYRAWRERLRESVPARA
jgi:adenylate cyclase